jgi:REP element-mobilizing transposase RayT
VDNYENIVSGKAKGYFIVKKHIMFEGAIYHVTQRAPGRELIFLEGDDYLYFLKRLKDVAREYYLRVFSFALLSNHLHLLIQITQKNLSASLKHFSKATHLILIKNTSVKVMSFVVDSDLPSVLTTYICWRPRFISISIRCGRVYAKT